MAKKVLVVDDEKLIVKGIRFSLEQDGMQVDCAYDGQEAIDLATNNKYDIIFIDAAKGKYPIFLNESLKLINKNGLILADNILYKGYVMSDYNKHKQRTAVNHLREYIKEITENPDFESKILEVGDGLSITRIK